MLIFNKQISAYQKDALIDGNYCTIFESPISLLNWKRFDSKMLNMIGGLMCVKF